MKASNQKNSIGLCFLLISAEFYFVFNNNTEFYYVFFYKYIRLIHILGNINRRLVLPRSRNIFFGEKSHRAAINSRIFCSLIPNSLLMIPEYSPRDSRIFSSMIPELSPPYNFGRFEESARKTFLA